MKLAPHIRSARRAMTLIEVISVMVVVAILMALLLPALARSRRTGRVPCVSNLKQIGLAYRLWSNDHDDQFPFASTNATSSLAFANSPQVFRHYAIMSNDLVTPKVLVCNSDSKRTRATDFVKFSNANVSYFVALDAREDRPQQILSGDRNVTGGTLSNGFMRVLTPATAAGWSAEIHVNAGNVGLADGSAQQMTSTRLNQHVQRQTLPAIRLAIP